MKEKRFKRRTRTPKKYRLADGIASLAGLLCAMMLGAVFYATMVYQLADAEKTDAAPSDVGRSGQPSSAWTENGDFSDAFLALPACELTAQREQEISVGGAVCRVTERTYQTEQGKTVWAVSASPAAYVERMAQENWQPQPVTGYTLAQLEAVYARQGENAMLCARSGERVYMLIAQADGQEMYLLGAQTCLEK